MVSQKLREMRQERAEEETRRTPFRPTISVVTQKLFAKKRGSAPEACEELYHDAIRRSENAKHPPPLPECTFVPTVAAFNAKIFEGVVRSPRPKID